MIIAVTGASGHLGANLVRRLLRNGHRVKAIIHHSTTGIDNLPVEQIHADVLNVESLEQAFSEVDIVIHLAAKISIVPWERRRVEEINVAGVRNIVSACVSKSVKRVIHISSIHAYEQQPLNKALDESCPFVDFSKSMTYECSKARGELIIKEAVKTGLNAVIIVPTGIVGPFDFEPSLFGAGLLTFARGSVPLTIAGGFDWVDARDIADGVLRAAEVAPPGEKYLLSGHWVSLKDVASQVRQVMGRSHH